MPVEGDEFRPLDISGENFIIQNGTTFDKLNGAKFLRGVIKVGNFEFTLFGIDVEKGKVKLGTDFENRGGEGGLAKVEVQHDILLLPHYMVIRHGNDRVRVYVLNRLSSLFTQYSRPGF